jgi:hypothetical protein
MCGAPKQNDFSSPAGKGLSSLFKHIPRLLSLGVNALYIRPLFESSSHGYDTVDYYHVERRLGNNDDLKGKIVAGDYRRLAHEGCLDSVTNYELYKSLWSSFQDQNIYELA